MNATRPRLVASRARDFSYAGPPIKDSRDRSFYVAKQTSERGLELWLGLLHWRFLGSFSLAHFVPRTRALPNILLYLTAFFASFLPAVRFASAGAGGIGSFFAHFKATTVLWRGLLFAVRTLVNPA